MHCLFGRAPYYEIECSKQIIYTFLTFAMRFFYCRNIIGYCVLFVVMTKVYIYIYIYVVRLALKNIKLMRKSWRSVIIIIIPAQTIQSVFDVFKTKMRSILIIIQIKTMIFLIANFFFNLFYNIKFQFV